MGVYIGVHVHVRTQSGRCCDTADAKIHQRTSHHQHDDVRTFYGQLGVPALIGVESSGYALWCHHLVEELGHPVHVGEGIAIRQFGRRQKTDRRPHHT